MRKLIDCGFDPLLFDSNVVYIDDRAIRFRGNWEDTIVAVNEFRM
jgi:hypothetical protein